MAAAALLRDRGDAFGPRCESGLGRASGWPGDGEVRGQAVAARERVSELAPAALLLWPSRAAGRLAAGWRDRQRRQL